MLPVSVNGTVPFRFSNFPLTAAVADKFCFSVAPQPFAAVGG